MHRWRQDLAPVGPFPLWSPPDRPNKKRKYICFYICCQPVNQPKITPTSTHQQKTTATMDELSFSLASHPIGATVIAVKPQPRTMMTKTNRSSARKKLLPWPWLPLSEHEFVLFAGCWSTSMADWRLLVFRLFHVHSLCITVKIPRYLCRKLAVLVPFSIAAAYKLDLSLLY